jgi:hypothetical protein
MANPGKYGTANVSSTTDTFATWLVRTNQMVEDMATTVMTVSANASGASANGNTVINGIFGATTIAVGTGLRGGNVTTNGTLSITTNTSITGTANVSANVNITGQLNVSNSASVQDVFVQNIRPSTNATYSVGTAANQFVNIYASNGNFTDVSTNTVTTTGLANLNSIDAYGNVVVNEATLVVANSTQNTFTVSQNGGLTANGNLSIGGLSTLSGNTTIGGDLTVNGNTSFAAGISVSTSNSQIVDLTVSNTATITGNTQIGNADTDILQIVATVNSNVIPTGSRTLGNTANRWNYVYATNVDVATSLATEDLTVNGNLVFGSNTSDTVTINALYGSNIIPSSNGNLQLGQLGKRWQVYANTASIATVNTATISAPTDFTLSTAASTITLRSSNTTNLKASTNSTNSFTVWHAGNDGSGSGLDADVLDGNDSSYYTNATNISSGTLAVARLATSGVTAGTYGNTTVVPVVTVDNKGRVTSASTTSVNPISSFSFSSANNTLVLTETNGTANPVNIGTFGASITAPGATIDASIPQMVLSDNNHATVTANSGIHWQDISGNIEHQVRVHNTNDLQIKTIGDIVLEPGGNDIYPSSNNSYNLGTSAKRFNNGYFGGTVYGTFSGNLTGNVTGNVTGNAGSATVLQTARTIGGVSFNGSANINLPGVNTSGTQNTSGNAATATQLQTPRTINGASFNGTTNITVEPYIERDDSSNATRYLTFADNATAAYKRLNMDSGLSYNPSTNTLTTGTFNGRATSANYADLAEKYTTDIEHAEGTVMMIGSSDASETEACNSDGIPVGVVSLEPAYLMNAAAEGQALALKGRVPVRVVGAIMKGEAVYPAENGTASKHSTGPMVGIALESNSNEEEKLVECLLKV